MKQTKRVKHAVEIATKMHEGQYRKSREQKPYIVHPIEVGEILKQYHADEDVIIAGILHDTIEDTPYTEAQLRTDFGDRVGDIVMDVTEDQEIKNRLGPIKSWDLRKQRYIDHLRQASMEGLLVCSADKISNLRSIYNDYQDLGENLWLTFSAPAEKYLWFFTEVLKAVRDNLDHPIVEEFETTFNKVKQLLAK